MAKESVLQVRMDSELKEQVDNYRKDVFMVQTGRMGTVDVLKDLEARSDELHADNLMDDYLNTELGL